MKVLQFPLVKIAFGLLLGLIIAYHITITMLFAVVFVGIALLLFLFSYWFTTPKAVKKPFFEMAVLFLSLAMGIFILVLHTESNYKNNYVNFSEAFEKSNQMEVVVSEKLKNSAQNNRYVALVQTLNNQKIRGKIILIIPKNNTIKELEVGALLRFKAQLTKNATPKNPNQFDYATYLKNKQIYAQAYIAPEEVTYRKKAVENIWYFTSKLRNTIVTHLAASGFDKKELAVAIALFLGQQQDIDSSITKDYQYAGTVHILSVSGLHIGCIVLFINFLLTPIPNTQKGRFFKLTLSLISLILFGILAGLAPSVVRSVTMFSFVAIGHYLKRSTNIYHTLVVSMLLILLFQPYFLFDVGFQLSYAALFFIVWLQPLLAKIWSPKNKWSQFFWDILTVSFAAQIGTLPLSIYYFHQFPGLFFVANLLVLPLLSVIMLFGVMVMAIAAFSTMPIWLIQPLEWGITLMNSLIHWVASFESFIFTNISSNSYLLLSTYFLLIASIVWFKKQTFSSTVFLLISICIVQLVVIKNKFDYGSSTEWVVLNAPKKTIICKRIGNEIEVFSNKNTLQNLTKNSVVQNYATGNFSTICKKRELKNVAYFNEKRIFILDSSKVILPKMQPDILLLTQSPKVNLARILQKHHPKMVLADASNYQSMVTLWKKTCNEQKIPFHATTEKGYFVLKN